jgi:hypothetical protein
VSDCCIWTGIPWANADIFLFSIVSLILIASLVGFLIAIFRFYCWKTTPGTNPTPTTLYTDPPDIGSVEAEFQNEFIGVFPMHQLKPRIDLN